MFRKDPFLAYFFLSSSVIFLLLCFILPVALYADGLFIWSSSSSLVPTAVEATQGALFQLERWLEYWCLPFNLSKYEASFFSVHPHQANLQSNLLLFNSHLHFNSTPTFLEVTFDCTLSFSKHVSLLKAKFFPVVVTRSLSWDGGMVEDHGAPEAGQLSRAWTRGCRETESRQRASATKSPLLDSAE